MGVGGDRSKLLQGWMRMRMNCVGTVGDGDEFVPLQFFTEMPHHVCTAVTQPFRPPMSVISNFSTKERACETRCAVLKLQGQRLLGL